MASNPTEQLLTELEKLLTEYNNATGVFVRDIGISYISTKRMGGSETRIISDITLSIDNPRRTAR